MRIQIRQILPVVPIALGTLLFACLAGPVLGQAVDDASAKREFPAVLLPGATALIKAQYDERVAEVLVTIGSRMESGQVMIRFVDGEERVLVDRAAVLVRQAEVEHTRMRRLHSEAQISNELLENAVTSLALAEADLELARIRLAERSIIAPFDGVVAERYVDPGTSVELGDPLLRVISTGSLRLEVMLPEDVLPTLRRHPMLDVHVSSPPLDFAVPLPKSPLVVDPASRTILLLLRVDNPDERIVPGSSCSVSLSTESPAR